MEPIKLHKCPTCGNKDKIHYLYGDWVRKMIKQKPFVFPSKGLSILSDNKIYRSSESAPIQVYYVSCNDCGEWGDKMVSILEAARRWNERCKNEKQKKLQEQNLFEGKKIEIDIDLIEEEEEQT